MATFVSSQSNLYISVYDTDSIKTEVLPELVSEDSQLKWDQNRLYLLEDKKEQGLVTNFTPSQLSRPETVASGINNNEDDGKWTGAKSLFGDRVFFPLFHEGEYLFKNNFYNIMSGRTIQEGFNGTSIVETSRNDYRHVFADSIDKQENVSAFIYKREQNQAPRPYISFDFVNEFSIYSGTSAPLYSNGQLNYSILDTSVYEIMLDTIQSNDSEVIFNQPPDQILEVGPDFVSGSIIDYPNTLEDLILTNDSNTFMTTYFPVKESSLQLYSYNGTTLTQWTATNSFDAVTSSDQVYIVNNNYGEVILNTQTSSFSEVFKASYTAIPMMEYKVNTEYGKSYEAKEVDLNRITTLSDKGSVIYNFKDIEVFENLRINVSIDELATTDQITWTNSIYGKKRYKIVIKVVDNITNNPVANVPLKFSEIKGIGKLLGYEVDRVFYTDFNGEAAMYFQPPMLNDQAGLKDVTRNGGNPKVLDLTGSLTEHYFENIPSEIYLYGIYKDDPLIGITNPGEDAIQWDPDLKNGRKLVLYELSATARHPIYNSAGAFVPIRPAYVTSSTFVFNTDLIQDESSNDANRLGGYFLAGPRKTSFTVEVATQSISKNFVSNVSRNFYIITKLSDAAKGVYVNSSLTFPFGWRLPGSIDPSSQLGGALFVTINPVAGTANLLFESTTQKYFSSELPLKVTIV